MKSVMKLDKEGIQVLPVIIQFEELHPCWLTRTQKTHTHTHKTCNRNLSTY